MSLACVVVAARPARLVGTLWRIRVLAIGVRAAAYAHAFGPRAAARIAERTILEALAMCIARARAACPVRAARCGGILAVIVLEAVDTRVSGFVTVGGAPAAVVGVDARDAGSRVSLATRSAAATRVVVRAFDAKLIF